MVSRSVILALAAACLCAAQQNPYERMSASHAEVMAHLKSEARKLTDRAASELSSKASWEKVRERRRGEMLDMLGLDPPPPKTALNVRITGKIVRPGYVIEKIAFESLPQVYVTANLYIPTDREGPRPTVIYVCGHSQSPYGAKVQYQRHGHTFAKHGYVAMIIDPIQIAETFALHHGILNNEMYEWYSRGYTPAGLEVWNVIRALDYLETRTEVDATRFGVTGRSGGAAMSWFSAAVDHRLRVVAPVMGISTYAANVAENTQILHCDCMFAINARLHDMLQQGALIAPRPLLMAHGSKDRLFPVPGYEEFEKVVGGLYRSYGAGEQFRNIVVDTAHEDSDFLRGEAVRWFDQHLAEVPAREIDVSFEEVPGEDLAVFGGEPPANARNFRVHEFFVAQDRPAPATTRAQWEVRREALPARLRERVFGAFPESGGRPELRAGDLPAVDGFEAAAFESEPGVIVQGRLRRAREPGGAALLWIASDGEDWAAINDVLRQTRNSPKRSILVVYPRGVGEIGWTKKLWKDAQRNAMHLGRTVDSMRLWDVLQAAAALRDVSGSEVVTAGSGVAGALGLWAGILDERIPQSILFDAPTTHLDGPIFLNILRYSDLPEAAALMAPRRVTFYGSMPAAYRETQGIFTLYGRPDQISLTMSLEAAVAGRHDHNFSSGI